MTIAAIGLAGAAPLQAAPPPRKVVAPPIITVQAPPPPIAPPVVMPVPAPPAPPAPNFGPAPKAEPWPFAYPVDSDDYRKRIKEMRKQRGQETAACSNRETLKPWMTKAMVEACDRALALPVEPGTSWVVRGELLHFRALALINGQDFTNALAALDEADALAAAGGDPLFDLSTGIGNKLLRAYVLKQRGKTAEAKDLLDQVRKLRPWSWSTVMSADTIEAGFSPGDVNVPMRLMAARFRIDPDVARALIYLYTINGDIKAAAAMGNRVSLVDPKMGGGWSLGGADSEEETMRDRVRMDCTKAYLALALGDKAGSDALFATVGQYLESYIGIDPQLVTDKTKSKPSKSDIRRYEEHLAIGTRMRELLGEWQQVAARRNSFPERTTEALLNSFKGYKHTSDLLPAVIDQLRLMATLVPASESARLKSEADQFVRILFYRSNQFSADKLGELMPRPERLEQIPKFASTASKWLFSDGSGYSQSKELNSDVRTVRYETQVGSRAMVEEMLLLAAANYARQEGKDAFVILSNRTLGRRTTVTGWGGGYTYDSGVEAQARIMLVNSTALPPEFATSTDRVITAAEVERDIKPRYDGYIARKAAEKAAQEAAKKK